jgi:hypothetical protein
MRTATAVPYRRAASNRVTAAQWEVVSTDPPTPLAPILSGLDYSSVLRLRREVIVDLAGLRTDCGLSSNVPLLLAATWSSGGTMLRRSLGRVELPADDDACLLEIVGEISGGDIADTLHIDTIILTSKVHEGAPSLAARLAGSVLLQERQTVQLDTSISFFPVEVVDFNSGVWANPAAGWRLSWNPFALEQPFLGSVRLLVNAAHPRVAHAVSGEAPTAEATAIRSAIYFDVARALVLGSLASEDFVDREGDYSDGTCGKVVYTLLQMLFPGDSMRGLAIAATQRADHFCTDLQGRLRVFWN